MEQVKIDELQTLINSFANEDVYIHLETTNGAYASHFDEKVFNAGCFIRNIVVQYELGKVTAEAPHRVGLKLANGGWIYAQGITHFELDEQGRLLMAGHDYEGKLAVALEISKTPFSY
ncbi:YojF family protein [Kurthia senegalensis]|uniref:YojF family protein n=1 Tax=Kurthia senegalensis TaxID=1033740 RepID=UPI00028A3098|nr:YojF family protein [Kurthia senegalensis]